MRHHSLATGIFALGLLACITSAQAGNESWVSGNGTDAGNCTFSAPCRTFQFAHDQTSNNGSVNVLTSGNFGPVTITKPISIVAQGVEAVINTGATGAAVNIDAGANAMVSLRGLTIDMRGTSNDGIHFNSGAALRVHDTVIRKSAIGIYFGPISGVRELYVADTTVEESAATGIHVQPGEESSVAVMLDRVRVENGNDIGMFFEGNAIRATVRDSVAANNTIAGISACCAITTNVMVERSSATGNGTGIGAFTSATVRIADSVVTGNAQGLFASGTIASYGTNKINGNGGNETPSSISLK